ncbi:MAG: serine/threonine-protein kinase [Polyangiales bacterium]
METVPHTFRSELSAGTIVGGDFEVERRLAAGGMGEVYLVKQRSTGARRALKRMHAHLVEDPVTRERFEREAKIVARIDSSHVAQVIAAGIDPILGEPYIAMELLRGPTLAEVLKAGALSWPRAKMIMQGVGHAIAAAHRAGVIHRDLKPENVMLAESQVAGMDVIVKVLDFGVSLATKGTLAKRITGDLSVGTPHYMAPEQFSDSSQVSPATDVWALGLLLFEMLTAQKFWRVDLRSEAAVPLLIQEVVTDPIPSSAARAAEKGTALALEISSWIDSCLQREPSLRFRDAQAAMTALAQVEAGPTPATIPPTSAGASMRPPHDAATVAVRAPFKPVASAPPAPPSLPSAAAPRAATSPSMRPLVLLAAAIVAVGIVAALVAQRSADTARDGNAPTSATDLAKPPHDARASRETSAPDALDASVARPDLSGQALIEDAATAEISAAPHEDRDAAARARTTSASGAMTIAQRNARAIESVRARLRASNCLDRGEGSRTVGVWHVCFEASGEEDDHATTNVRSRVNWCVHDSEQLGRVRGPAWPTRYCVDVRQEYSEP